MYVAGLVLDPNTNAPIVILKDVGAISVCRSGSGLQKLRPSLALLRRSISSGR